MDNMGKRQETYTVRQRDEGDGMLWATVDELPGLFVSGENPQELREALLEAITLYLSTPEVHVVAEFVGSERPIESASEQKVMVSA